jgi:hypothetical protein
MLIKKIFVDFFSPFFLHFLNIVDADSGRLVLIVPFDEVKQVSFFICYLKKKSR